MRDFLHRQGYASMIDGGTGRLSFVRRLTSDYYPRFHIYVEKNLTGQNFLTLHLDQKQPSYDGSRAHQGEYHGPLVAAEAQTIKKNIFQALDFTPLSVTPAENLIQKFLNRFF